MPLRGGNPSARIAVVTALFAVIAVLIFGRILFLSLIVGPSNAEAAAKTRTIVVASDAKRGTIFDRNGTVLAASVEATTVYCNPNEVTSAGYEARQIAAVLGGVEEDYRPALETENTSFAYIKRKVDVDVAAALKDLKLDGIYFLDDVKRVYPCGQTAGQVIGLVDSDGNGVSGLELYYNDILAGSDGELRIERGGRGYPIAGGLKEISSAVPGQDIVVSIDINVQEELEAQLAETVEREQVTRGDALLYDGGTGEIIAVASTPFLNPADRTKVEEGATTLLPINMAYEPGSIMKTATMCAILEGNAATPESEYWCPTELQADEYTIHDSHARPAETMTLAKILSESSNIGTALAASDLGFDNLYNKFVAYHFAQKTGVDFPGEATGLLYNSSTWTTSRAYNVSFGQGLMVTPLQVARFYGAIANDGVECTPHFLVSYPQTGEKISYPTEQVIENTAIIDPLIRMMQGVVREGTGTDARMSGFEPAGKTGTAQYVDENGRYTHDFNHISFVGFLPDTDSKLVCFVGCREDPGGGKIGSTFKAIMEFAANHYRIKAQ